MSIAANTGMKASINVPADLIAETEAITVDTAGRTADAVIPSVTTYSMFLFSCINPPAAEPKSNTANIETPAKSGRLPPHFKKLNICPNMFSAVSSSVQEVSSPDIVTYDMAQCFIILELDREYMPGSKYLVKDSNVTVTYETV